LFVCFELILSQSVGYIFNNHSFAILLEK